MNMGISTPEIWNSKRFVKFGGENKIVAYTLTAGVQYLSVTI
jgi:hypothetical protein